MIAKRSPMSIITSIYDDSYDFVNGLIDVFTPLAHTLGTWHSKMLKRLVDSVFVEQGADIMHVVDVYISAMVKVCFLQRCDGMLAIPHCR